MSGLTTYSPLVSSQVVSVASVLRPQAQRDVDTPDVGYHYWALDYALNTLVVTNTTLVLTNGTAIATFGSTGIWLQNNSQLISEGSPTRPNRFVSFNTVQEQSTNWGNGPLSPMAICPYNTANAPSAQFRFTFFDTFNHGNAHLLMQVPYWTYSSLTIQDCQFGSGRVQFDGYSNTVVTVNNSLFDQAWVDLGFLGDALQLSAYNSGFVECTICEETATTNRFLLRDNVFDTCYIEQMDDSVSGNNNAYITNNFPWRTNFVTTATFTPPGANDIVLAGFTYTNSTLGGYYQYSPNLLGKGSRSAAAAGLYHYTVLANQTKEANNAAVALGFHYVATDSQGVPLDYDGDGFPDYAEDRNGNGSVDSGETNWQLSNSGLSGSAGLQVFTPLK